MGFVCTKCKREIETLGRFCPFCGTAAPPARVDAEDPLVGQTLAGKYFVNARLGQGGMGQVYKATDVVLERPIALKVLNRSLLADPSMVQRFHREARAASRLNHPNCITILDFGQTEDEALFIAMEYLPGRSLAKLLADEAPLAQARVVRIVAQMLAALAEAHANGIIHRDLKLTNVMVDARREEPDFVKVLDFGIAKLSGTDEGGVQLTGTGIVCGTPGYMSPEQARGETLDARSDLYAVGVVLYELLSGRLPFDAPTPMAFVAKHLTETPRPLRERQPELAISPDLDALVLRALAKDPAQRPSSAEAMRDELLACALPADVGRATPRPERAHTVIFAAPRPETPARSAGPAPGVLRFDGTRNVARASADGAPSPQPSTPSPAPATPGAATPAGATPSPSPSLPATPGPRPGGAEPAQARSTPSPARRPAARPGRNRGVVIAVAAGVALAVGGVVYALLSDPFAAKQDAHATDDVVLALPGGAGGAPPSAGGGVGTPKPPTKPPADPPPPPTPATPPDVAPPPLEHPAPPPVKTDPPRPPAPRKGSGVLAQSEGKNVLPVPAAATGQGILTVTASPWGVVWVDGREIGETPRELRVGEGFYRIKVVHPTLGAKQESVTVPAGRRAAWHVAF